MMRFSSSRELAAAISSFEAMASSSKAMAADLLYVYVCMYICYMYINSDLIIRGNGIFQQGNGS
jgi:hypothetical protein